MTPLSRDLHPSNGRRGSSTADDVVVPISAASTAAPRTSQQATEGTEGSSDASKASAPHGADYTDDAFPTELHWEILDMLGTGCADDMIAHRLNLAPCTYHALVRELAAHLGACNRFQLALKAREEGWV
ncbi:MAG: hypothetical protein Q4C81_01030 [Kocuria sp.]|nr:hypothetical protein [Kocuria sp.]